MENNGIISEANTSIYSETTLESFKKFKNAIQKIIIWTLVGGAIAGAILILCTGTEFTETLGKFMGTLFLLAGSAFVTLIDFNGIESKKRGVQIFATLGVFMNICWTILWILALWGVFDIWVYENCHTGIYSELRYCPTNGYSIMGMLTLASSYLSSLGLFGSVTLGIYEGKKKSTIRPLKIAAISSLVYTEIHATLRIFTINITDTSTAKRSLDTFSAIMGRLDLLAAFAGFVWFVLVCVAFILGRQEKNAMEYAERKEKEEKQRQLIEQAAANIASNQQSMPQVPKTDDELRAEIEEKVRREMIEKEVREKVEKEMAAKKND